MCLTVWLLGQRLNGKSRLCMTIRAGRRADRVGRVRTKLWGPQSGPEPVGLVQLKWDQSPCLIQGHFRD